MMSFREKLALHLEQLRDDFWLFVAYVADRMEREKHEAEQRESFDGYDWDEADDNLANYDMANFEDDFDHAHAEHSHSYTDFDDDTTIFNNHYHDNI